MKTHFPDTARTNELDLFGHRYELVATPDETGTGWTSRIVRYSHHADARLLRRPIIDHRSYIHDQASIVHSFRGHWVTAASALADLATQLQTAVTEAVREEIGTHEG